MLPLATYNDRIDHSLFGKSLIRSQFDDQAFICLEHSNFLLDPGLKYVTLYSGVATQGHAGARAPATRELEAVPHRCSADSSVVDRESSAKWS